MKLLESLVGKVITNIEGDNTNINNSEKLIFHTECGLKYEFYHDQDCCECVLIEDIVGNLDDLIGSPIKMSEYNSSQNTTDCGSETWTFYKFATIKGYVTIRWRGESNGCYSESVSLKVIDADGRCQEEYHNDF